MAQNERTLKMKKEYTRLFFEEGFTPKEIAKKFDLSSWTVYQSLDEIAKEAGVSRESLLVRPHRSPSSRETVFTPAPTPQIDIEGIREYYQQTLGHLKELLALVNEAIEQEETTQERG